MHHLKEKKQSALFLERWFVKQVFEENVLTHGSGSVVATVESGVSGLPRAAGVGTRDPSVGGVQEEQER